MPTRSGRGLRCEGLVLGARRSDRPRTETLVALTKAANAVANFGRKCIPAWDRGCSTRQRWKVSRFAMGSFTVRTRGITRKAVPPSRSDSNLFQSLEQEKAYRPLSRSKMQLWPRPQL